MYVFRGILRALHSLDAAPNFLSLSVRVALTQQLVVTFRVDNFLFNNITIGDANSSGLLHLYSFSTASGASLGLPMRLDSWKLSTLRVVSSCLPQLLNILFSFEQLSLRVRGDSSIILSLLTSVFELRASSSPTTSSFPSAFE